MTIRTAGYLVVFTIATISSLAHADVAYANYDPADENTISSNMLYILSASSPDARFGFSFVAGASGLVTEVNAAAYSFGSPSAVVFDLYADNGAGIPGALLGSWTDVVDQSEYFHAQVASPSVQLTAGETYHFVLRRPSAGSGSTRWFLADPIDTLTQVNQSNDGAWSQDFNNTNAGAFQILVTPSPASLAVFGIGVIAAGRRRRPIPA